MCSLDRTTIMQDLVLAVVINTTALLLTQAPLSFTSWYLGACAAFATNVLVQLVVPVPAVGRVLTRFLGSSRGRPACSVFVENFVFVTVISLTMAVLQADGRSVVDVWSQTYVALLLVGYATSLVLYGVVHARSGRLEGRVVEKTKTQV